MANVKKVINPTILPPEPKGRYQELGPHPERWEEAKKKAEMTGETLLDVEVNLTPVKPHHYGFWAIIALFVGLSATYGVINAGNIALNHLVSPPASMEDSLAANPGPNQGSDDATSSTDSEVTVSGSYSILSPQKSLSLSSTDYVIGDISTGDIILEKNGTTKSPMASVTKLMTATIELETLNQRGYATVTPAAIKYYPLTGDLVMNEIMKISDLKYPLLVVSSNVAAEVFADYVGRDKFLQELNDKAKKLGMINSHYNDPSGLDPQSYSTPEDLFLLAQYIKANHPEIFDIGRIREYSILGHTWINQNHQLTYSNFAGGKNGFTDQAEKTTVSLFDLSFDPNNKNNKRTVAIVLLHTNDREGDISKILKYLSSNVRFQEKALDVGGTQPGPAANGNPDN